MELKIYVDVLFITNFMFDFLLLQMTGALLHSHAPLWRILSASSFGALYALLAFFLPQNTLLLLPCKLIAGAIMASIAFFNTSLRRWVQHLFVFFAVSCLWAGASFCLFSLSDVAPAGSLMRNGITYINMPIYRPLLIAFIIFPLTRLALYTSTKATQISKETTELCIAYRGKTLHLRAFYDSGNFLQDAVTGKGVIIARWQWAKPFFPECASPEETQNAGTIPICYNTLGASSRLYAFWPDAIYIKTRHKLTQVETAYIGLTDKAFDYQYNWDAILPRNFKGENHHETQLTPNSAHHYNAPKTPSDGMAS